MEIPSSRDHTKDDAPKASDKRDKRDEYGRSRRSKFRLKSKHSSSKSSGRKRSRSRSNDYEERRHRHRHKHHKPTIKEPDAPSPQLSPNAAFRESLFDALADDEGASYWESVYGQPVHAYERPYVATEGQGELEMMTDEEYTAYVRARMWEKTHQGILEERERRQQAREEEKERARQQQYTRGGRAETEREAFNRMVDESLKRGKEREAKKKKSNKWVEIWKRYLDSWEDLNSRAKASQAPSDNADQMLRNLIVWPVESGKRKDINPTSVETFINNAPLSSTTPTQDSSPALPPRSELLAILKMERVRWHPDKIQHRYGTLGVEEQIVKSATEVFQILDRMWGEEQNKLKKG